MATSQDYVVARALVASVLKEDLGGDTIPASEVLTRLQEWAQALAKEEASRIATIEQITHIACELDLRGPTGDNDEIRNFARILLQHFTIEPTEEQCPF